MTAQALAPEPYRLQTAEAGPLVGLPGRPTTTPHQVGVTVVGGDPLSREGVIRFLQECPDLRVLGDLDTNADVIVAVIDRVGEATLPLLRSLRQDAVGRIVLLVGDLDVTRAAEVVQAGAVGIMRRSEVSRSSLRRLIRFVFSGDAVLPPDVLDVLLDRRSGERSGGHRSVNLSVDDREVKVLRLLADGADTREIAHRLCYSERTVKTVIQDIANRFGLRNRAHAVAYAIRQGLI